MPSLSSVAASIQRVGLQKTVLAYGLETAKRIASLRVLRAVVIHTPKPEFLELVSPFRAECLSAAELGTHPLPENFELTPEFLASAHARSDSCFAIFEGESLASIGWYTHRPCPVEDGVEVEFDPRYVYMYRGFTEPRYRGLRLHAIGMSLACKHFENGSYRGLVSYVNAGNASSLTSCERMGYQTFGNGYILFSGKHKVAFTDRRCSEYAFRLRRAASTAASSAA
jgi:hypothetical protein